MRLQIQRLSPQHLWDEAQYIILGNQIKLTMPPRPPSAPPPPLNMWHSIERRPIMNAVSCPFPAPPHTLLLNGIASSRSSWRRHRLSGGEEITGQIKRQKKGGGPSGFARQAARHQDHTLDNWCKKKRKRRRPKKKGGKETISVSTVFLLKSGIGGQQDPLHAPPWSPHLPRCHTSAVETV